MTEIGYLVQPAGDFGAWLVTGVAVVGIIYFRWIDKKREDEQG